MPTLLRLGITIGDMVLVGIMLLFLTRNWWFIVIMMLITGYFSWKCSKPHKYISD